MLPLLIKNSDIYIVCLVVLAIDTYIATPLHIASKQFCMLGWALIAMNDHNKLYKLNDILFFIKSSKLPSPHFNIHHYITFSNSSTRFSEHSKLHIKSFSNISRHFYACRLLRLWNVLPHIYVNLPIPFIKKNLYKFLWQHFVNNFDFCCVCSFHFCCPCSKCIVTPKPHI